jgi:hypothetical protein
MLVEYGTQRLIVSASCAILLRRTTMAKRLRRKLTEVAKEVEQQLKAHYNVTDAQLATWRKAAQNHKYTFPVSTLVPIEDIWIDYEVQRDVIHDHIRKIMQKWDPRICSPVSACRLTTTEVEVTIDAYDGQHRTVAAAILGYKEIPCAVVDTKDPNFASYAFEMLNDTGVRRLGPADLHRNALVRYKNGSREIRNVKARTMQDQFDALGIDLEDKKTRSNPNLRGSNEYFFSHFKYAQKGIDVDDSGKVLNNILGAIQQVFQMQEEIDQGVYIGLYELHRLASTNVRDQLPEGWMVDVLKKVKKSFKSSSIAHAKAKVQQQHIFPGASWDAPRVMSNFLREVYMLNGGKLNLPYHGEGSKVGILDGNLADGLIQEAA